MASRRKKRTLPTLGHKVREARLLAVMNQHQLAEAVGCSYTKIVHIENGKGAEPWLIDAVARKLGFSSLREVVASPADAQALLQGTPLPGVWKARFDGPESSEVYQKFLRGVVANLAEVPGLIEFTFSRPANSLIFGVRATSHKHQAAIFRLAYGWGIRKEPQGGRILAHIYKMRLPRVTLDWPVLQAYRSYIILPKFATLRDVVALFVRYGRIQVRNNPDGSAVLIATDGPKTRQRSLDPTSH